MVSVNECRISFRRYLAKCVRMVRELFGGSLPVFVAATISRAAMSFISLMADGDTQASIGITFVYAFCFLQILGIAITVRLDHSHVIFPYTLHVVTELTGFAWKEFVTIIMLKWLFEHKLAGAAIGAWLLIIFIAFLMVYIFNAALALYFQPEPKIFEGLRDFNTDAMSLAIAFSFTLIAASQIYPEESAGNLAGSESEHSLNIEDEGGGNAGYLFLAYAFAITFIIAGLTWKLAPLVNKENDQLVSHVGFGDPNEDDNSVAVAGAGAEGATPSSLAAAHADALKASEEENERFWKSIDSSDPDSRLPSPPRGAAGAAGDVDPPQQGGPIIRPKHSVVVGRDSLSGGGAHDDIFSTFNTWWSYLDNLLFAWDPNGYSKSSLAHLVNTSGGYTVGCAWYTFAVITFQNLFSSMSNGRLLGLFLYAMSMTGIVVFLMERIERRQTRIWERQMAMLEGDERSLSAYRSRYKRNTELVRVAGRLLCGWSWSDFVTACADAVITDTETAEMTKFHSSSWIGALVKTAIAVILFACGAYYTKIKYNADQARAGRLSSGGSSRSSSRGLSLQEHREKHAALQADFLAEYGDDFGESGGTYTAVDVEEHDGFKAPLLRG